MEVQLSYPSSVIIWGKQKTLRITRLDQAKDPSNPLAGFNQGQVHIDRVRKEKD